MTPHPPSHRPWTAKPAGSLEGDPAGIDLTPLLDVVFIMLIFFLVTANFIRETGLPLWSGDSANGPGEPGIVLAVLADGYLIDGARVGSASIPGRLRQLLGVSPGVQVSLHVSPKSTTAQLVFAMDAARRVGAMDLPVFVIDEPGG